MQLSRTRISYLAAFAAAATLATPAIAQTRSARATPPRFLFAAAPRLRNVAMPEAVSTVQLSGPFDFSGSLLESDNPLADFITIDTTLLAKAPRADAAHHGAFVHDQPVPPNAIVALSRMTVRNGYPAFNTAFNTTYLKQFRPNQYPRVAYTGNQGHGDYQAEAAGVVGPKLILNGNMQHIRALATEPDELTVVLHASDTDFSRSDEAGFESPVGVSEVAALIKQEIRRRGLPRNVPIRLFACESGLRPPGDPQGAAQRLADAMVDAGNPEGNTITAPTGLSYHLPLKLEDNGVTESVVHPTQITYPIHDYDAGTELPRWRTFRPSVQAPHPARRAAHATAAVAHGLGASPRASLGATVRRLRTGGGAGRAGSPRSRPATGAPRVR